MSSTINSISALPVDVLRQVRRGTPLREGIDRIVGNRNGALIVLGDAPQVRGICQGPTVLNVPLTPSALAEAATAEGATIISSDLQTLVAHQVNMKPTCKPIGGYIGTKHQASDSTAQQFPGLTVIAVSETRFTITIFYWDGTSFNRKPITDTTVRKPQNPWIEEHSPWRQPALPVDEPIYRQVPALVAAELPTWDILITDTQFQMGTMSKACKSFTIHHTALGQTVKHGTPNFQLVARVLGAGLMATRIYHQLRPNFILLGDGYDLHAAQTDLDVRDIEEQISTLAERFTDPSQNPEVSLTKLSGLKDDQIANERAIIATLGIPNALLDSPPTRRFSSLV